MKRLIGVLACFALAAFAFVNTSSAQTINGTISGNVLDAQGAVVQGATVTATNVDTGLERSATSDGSGRYFIGGLPGGNYNVVVEGSGFDKFTRSNVSVGVAGATELNIELTTGGVAAEVEVVAAGELLDTTQSQVSKTVSAQQILELPGRNTLNGLALLVPGVLPNAQGRPGSGFAVNGNRTRSNNFTIDGANNNDQSLSIPRQTLPPEAIGEFNIITNTFAAEFGRNAGSYVNVITRSGTNKFSGSGFYVYQGNEYDALTTTQQRTFNANRAAGFDEETSRRRAKNVNVNSVYGGTLGGPIVKNHTFFFTSLDANPVRTTIGSVTRNALTAASRSFIQANAAQFASPAAVQFLLNTFPAANDPTVGTGAVQLINAAGTNIGSATFGTFNRTLTSPIAYGNDFYRWLMKVDTKINSKDRLSFRYLYDKFDDPGQPASLPGLELGQVAVNKSFTVNDAYLFSSNWLNEARFTYSSRDISFPENFDAFAAGAQLAVGSGAGAFNGGNANFPQGRNDKVYEFTDNVSWTRGKHNIKFGYNMLKYDLNSLFAPNSKGTISYASLSDLLNDRSNGLQNATGDFVVPAVTYEHSFFGQDDWKVNPDLTLNLGLRYEYVTTPFGYYSNAKSDINNFGPRIGFAWNPKNMFGGNMVLRAGFGVAYDQVFQNVLLNVSRNFPRVVQNVLSNTGSAPNVVSACVGCQAFLGFPSIPATAVANPALSGGLSANAFFARSPSNVPAAQIPLLPQRLFAPNERIKQPMSKQWTLGVQYLLASDYVFKAEYIGNRGSNLIREVEQNFGFVAPIGNGQRLDPTRGSILVGQGIANSSYHSGQFSFDRQVSNFNVFGKNLGTMGWQMNYTYSAFMSESDDVLGGQANRTIPADPRDPSLDNARSGFDQPHRFVFSSIWETPRVFNGGGIGNAIVRGLLSTWQLSQATTWASGTPFSILNGLNGAGILPGQISTVELSQRVGFNPNGTPNTFTTFGHPTITFNPNAMYIIYNTNTGIFGSLGANTERTPTTYNTNAALVKNIPTFGETQRLQLRLEVFNVFNRRNFTQIPTNTLTPTTSTFNFLNYGLTNVGGRGFTFGARYFF
jgi:outer membrane receptor protein involved in Fe transport